MSQQRLMRCNVAGQQETISYIFVYVINKRLPKTKRRKRSKQCYVKCMLILLCPQGNIPMITGRRNVFMFLKDFALIFFFSFVFLFSFRRYDPLMTMSIDEDMSGVILFADTSAKRNCGQSIVIKGWHFIELIIKTKSEPKPYWQYCHKI